MKFETTYSQTNDFYEEILDHEKNILEIVNFEEIDNEIASDTKV